MRIAYLGPNGSFSEEAAYKYFSSEDIEWHMCETILDVLEAVDEGKADKGIAPIENSIEGTINITADGLLAHDLFIEAEVILPVSIHLLTAEEIQEKDIREVWSISPALAQCRDYMKGAKLKSKLFDSTSSAAKAIQEQKRRDVAAAASEWAANSFDLHIAKRNIQDHDQNRTRFVVFGMNKAEDRQPQPKTLLIITPSQEHPGVLSAILNVFSALSINLTWIESRPTKKKLGTYRFFIETENGPPTSQLSKAITALKAFEHDVRVLGSYDTTEL